VNNEEWEIRLKEMNYHVRYPEMQDHAFFHAALATSSVDVYLIQESYT
jgi:hypothetical protein